LIIEVFINGPCTLTIMQFEHNKKFEEVGEKIGFLFSYFLFTAILFFIFTILKKIPGDWSYMHMMPITIAIVVLGVVIKRLLK